MCKSILEAELAKEQELLQVHQIKTKIIGSTLKKRQKFFLWEEKKEPATPIVNSEQVGQWFKP